MGCKIYLVRHGETIWNHALRYQGHADIPLNERGKRQAEALAERLKGEEFAAFYASDLQRALDTARIVARPHGKEVIPLASLREINFGAWEGLTREEIKKRFPEVAERWWQAPYHTRLPGGETLAEVAARAVGTLKEIAERHPESKVLVVSHGGTIRAAIGYLLRMDLNQYWRLRQDNAALNIIELFEEEKAILMLFNDTSHLNGI
ncbi:alpha-ribazole phosphatase [Ammonifex thiophilus]|uniref:Alpha-ribazole phosphatase n=1 Tax=Ammonifex thiophilus TaxID=444093 RepID=A0A3D8P5R7_9THEO|nr:alpha-ribazole phosphatase [Ammonifex thiophilus]RDV83420.1 alpha-ribazole phosphatase [Ammonifex thiophilus]